MKKNLQKLVLIALLTVIGSIGIATGHAKASTLYRGYNPNTGEHLYSQNSNEIPSIVKFGWKNEGLAWSAPDKGIAVYRLFNPNNGGDHFYTLNTNERDHLKKSGWRYEGISWFSGGSVPVYRLYNPNAKSGTHHYTVLASERDILKRAGWRDEGVGFYANKLVPEGSWVTAFEAKLYAQYKVTTQKYEYIGNNSWKVWVNEYNTGNQPYVTVDSVTGNFHG